MCPGNGLPSLRETLRNSDALLLFPASCPGARGSRCLFAAAAWIWCASASCRWPRDRGWLASGDRARGCRYGLRRRRRWCAAASIPRCSHAAIRRGSSSGSGSSTIPSSGCTPRARRSRATDRLEHDAADRRRRIVGRVDPRRRCDDEHGVDAATGASPARSIPRATATRSSIATPGSPAACAATR